MCWTQREAQSNVPPLWCFHTQGGEYRRKQPGGVRSEEMTPGSPEEVRGQEAKTRAEKGGPGSGSSKYKGLSGRLLVLPEPHPACCVGSVLANRAKS